MLNPSDLARFEAKFTKSDGCWEWTAARDKDGYGIFGSGKTRKAHRLAYLHFVGLIMDGLCVCHCCDNPSCVRPDHLFLDTPAGNNADKTRKGRQAKGEDFRDAKLTAEQVADIRADTRPPLAIANDYGVSQVTIGNIKRRKTWRHVA